MKNEKEATGTPWVWVVILMLLFWAILLWLAADLYLDKQREIRDEKTRNKQALEQERERLKGIIEEKKSRIKILDARFKKLFLLFRLTCIAMWLLAHFLLISYTSILDSIGSIVDINALALMIILGFNFAIYGKITDTKELVGQIQERLRNMVYKKSLGIKEELIQYNRELDMIESKIVSIERELKLMEQVA